LAKEWALQIKADILDLKSRVTILEAKISTMEHVPTPEGTTGLGGKELKAESGDISDLMGSMGDSPSSNSDSTVDKAGIDLAKATGLIRESAVAFRGYGLLLDQFGLSRDQKKLIQQIMDTMMMVMKLITAIKIAKLAMSTIAGGATPLGIFYTVIAGGMTASSLGYASKSMSGGV
jgi:hypothetical protein